MVVATNLRIRVSEFIDSGLVALSEFRSAYFES
jgi:hypothetical protein